MLTRDTDWRQGDLLTQEAAAKLTVMNGVVDEGHRVVVAGHVTKLANQVELVGGQHGAFQDVFDGLPGIGEILLHHETKQVGRIGTDRFREGPDAIERHLRRAVLEHRDDVGFLEAAFFGNFALGLVALSETIGDEVSNGSAMGQVSSHG